MLKGLRNALANVMTDSFTRQFLPTVERHLTFPSWVTDDGVECDAVISKKAVSPQIWFCFVTREVTERKQPLRAKCRTERRVSSIVGTTSFSHAIHTTSQTHRPHSERAPPPRLPAFVRPDQLRPQRSIERQGGQMTTLLPTLRKSLASQRAEINLRAEKLVLQYVVESY